MSKAIRTVARSKAGIEFVVEVALFGARALEVVGQAVNVDPDVAAKDQGRKRQQRKQKDLCKEHRRYFAGKGPGACEPAVRQRTYGAACPA